MKKTIFDKRKKKKKSAAKRLSIYENPSNILRSKKAYDLKIAQSIICVKEYFYAFLYPERYYTSGK